MAPFRFYCPCPQSILMESDTSQVGQQCQCPTCGLQFIVPNPAPSQAAAPGPPPGYEGHPQGAATAGHQRAAMPGHVHDAQPYDPHAHYTHQQVGPDNPLAEIHVADGPPPEVDLESPAEDPNRIVTVICPNGCELETPMSMIGTDAMCPQCNAQFRLRYEDTLEYKEEQEREKERREQQFSESALKWAIVMAVLVGIAIIGMFVMVALR